MRNTFPNSPWFSFWKQINTTEFQFNSSLKTWDMCNTYSIYSYEEQMNNWKGILYHSSIQYHTLSLFALFHSLSIYLSLYVWLCLSQFMHYVEFADTSNVAYIILHHPSHVDPFWISYILRFSLCPRACLPLAHVDHVPCQCINHFSSNKMIKLIRLFLVKYTCVVGFLPYSPSQCYTTVQCRSFSEFFPPRNVYHRSNK